MKSIHLKLSSLPNLKLSTHSNVTHSQMFIQVNDVNAILTFSFVFMSESDKNIFHEQYFCLYTTRFKTRLWNAKPLWLWNHNVSHQHST